MGAKDMFSRLKTAVSHRPVLAFFILAFLWTWGYDALVYLMVGQSPGILVRGIVRAWGPLISAGTVTWAINGDIREWAGQVTKWRVKPRWYAIAIVFPFLLKGGVVVGTVHVLMGGSVQFVPSPWWHYVANFLAVFFLAGGLEEFGWRGFAQPRLQEQYSALIAAICIGVAWTLWHLPLYYLFELSAYEPARFWTSYLPFTVVSSVLLAWLYNGTKGSLLFPMLFHSLGNLPLIVDPIGETSIITESMPEVLAVAVVLILLVRYGTEYLAPSGPSPRIPGENTL